MAATPLTSPTLTAASVSSFDVVSSPSLSSADSSSWSDAPTSDDSDDEIVYNVSEGSFISDSSRILNDDDFVVLSRHRSVPEVPDQPAPDSEHSDDEHSDDESISSDATRSSNMSQLASQFEDLQVVVNIKPSISTCEKQVDTSAQKATKKRRKRRAAARARAVGQSSTPTPVKAVKKEANKKEANESKAKTKSVVNGPGEQLNVAPTMYDEAYTFITSFLSNPEAKKDSVCHLTLLQSLIVELGLATSSLPSSLTSAKAFLKSHAFLNIREYLAVRGNGPEAVQKILHPSRSALRKDIQKKRNQASLKWVKKHGLQVLLVPCFR